jgi:hypothetical protein
MINRCCQMAKWHGAFGSKSQVLFGVPRHGVEYGTARKDGLSYRSLF